MPTLTYADLRDILRDFALSENLTYDPKLCVYSRESSGPLAGTTVTPDELAKHAWLDMRGESLNGYRIAMQRMIEEDRDERKRTHAMMMCNVDDPYDLAMAELRRFVKLMAHDDTSERRLDYYVTGWKQLIWQVKRKMLGLETSWEIMLSLVSRSQGTGKTHAAKDFGYLLGEFFMAHGDCTLFSDPFRIRGLNRYYLVLLDEFDRANKSQVTTFKRLISSDTVASRQIYTDSDLQVRRNASFIVTSNRSIANDIADSSMRRFVEMRCREQRATDVFIDKMSELDWARIWSAADAREPAAPASEASELMSEFQAELTSQSELDEWLEERVVFVPQNANVRVRLGTLFADYREWARMEGNKHMRKHTFFREIRDRYTTQMYGNVEGLPRAQLRVVDA